MAELPPLPAEVLPAGIRARFVSGVNGLRMHVLEAGSRGPGHPCILLLHGFPELAYSLAQGHAARSPQAGFHVIAPDQRGYGRTTGWSANYDDDLRPFRLLNAVRDAVGLVAALGYRSVASVVGHDFGASIAAWCALVRPDMFGSVALMSAPFGGPPDLPVRHRAPSARRAAEPDHPRGAGRPPAAAQALPVVVLDARRQRAHVALQAGRPRFPARLLPPQERGLEAEPTPPARRVVGGGAGEDADLLHHGPRRRHARRGGEGDAVAPGDRRLPLAARRRARRVRRGVRAHRVPGRAQLVPLAQQRRLRGGAASSSRAGPSTCRRSSSRARATGASISARVPSSGCSRSRAPRMVGYHLLEGAGHWVQQEQAPRVSELLVDFLKGRAG